MSSNPNAGQANAAQPQAYLEYTDDSGATQTITFDLIEDEDGEQTADISEHPVEVGADVADHVRVGLPTVSLKAFSTNEPLVSNQWADPTLEPLPLSLGAPTWTPSNGVLNVTSWNSSLLLRSLGATLVGLGAGAAAGYPASAIATIIAMDVAALTIPGSAGLDAVQTDAGLEPTAQPTTVNAQTQQWGDTATDFVEQLHALLVQLKNKATLFTVFGTKEILPNMVIQGLAFHRSEDEGCGESVTVSLKQVRIVATQTVTVPIPNLPAGGGQAPAKKGAQDPAEAPPALKSLALTAVQGLGALSSSPMAIIGSLFGGGAP